MRFNVDIFGTYPPPIGGTSIHLQRLHNRNRKKGIGSVVYDTYTVVFKKTVKDPTVIPVNNYKRFLLSYFFSRRAQIIHSHSHSWVERMILTLKANICGQKIIFTFHSLRDEKEKFSRLQKIAYNYTIKHSDLFIATGTVVKDKMISWGINESKVRLIMPFIAPSMEDGTVLPDDMLKFTNRFKYVITANSSNNDFFNGADLYGHDMCIELMKDLKDREDVGLVFVMTKITQSAYLDRLRQMIKEYGLQDRILLYEGCVDFISLLKKTSIFVRPTNTDSWPISMSESLSLGVPCICSNVCKRENAAILFESRNQDDFNNVVKNVLDHYQEECNKLKDIVIADNYDAVLQEYINLLK